MSARKFSRIVTPTAYRDYEDILLYTYRTWGEHQVDDYELALLAGMDHVQVYPESGAKVLGQDSRIRKWHVRHHVIFYEIDAEHRMVTVLRLLHERRRVTVRLLMEAPE